jgi:hypothetical protein
MPVPATAAELTQRGAEPVAGRGDVLVDEPHVAQCPDDPVCGGSRQVERGRELVQPERPVGAAQQPEHGGGPLDGLDGAGHAATLPVLGVMFARSAVRQCRTLGVDPVAAPS